MSYTSKTITDNELDFWIQNDLNVLMAGLHGVGKTAMIKEAFERNGLKWRYFSAATMDPWTDFVGVPKERQDDDGNSYLDFVLPKEFADDDVEALFFDEFNRAPKKVRNAVMELMQFKSINGRKFKNLKLIWAAVNPKDAEDMDFDVEEIDPAQEDRFHVQVEIPYKPNYKYFASVYGEDIAKAAEDWWNSLDKETKMMVSPRRLDYALQAFQVGGDLRFLLPKEANTSALYNKLQHGSPEKHLRKLMKSGDKTKARQWLGHEQNVTGIKSLIESDPEVRKFALPLLSEERIVMLMTKSKDIKDEITGNPTEYEEVIRSLANGSQNKRIKKQCQELVGAIERTKQSNGTLSGMIPVTKLPEACPKWEQRHFVTNFHVETEYDVSDAKPYGDDVEAKLRTVVNKTVSATNTYFRGSVFKELVPLISGDLSAEHAKVCLRMLDWFVSSSNSKSLEQNPDIPVLINTCIHCIQQEEPSFDIPEIYELASYTFYKFFSEKSPATLPKRFMEALCIKPKAKKDQVDCRQKDPALEEVEI